MSIRTRRLLPLVLATHCTEPIKVNEPKVHVMDSPCALAEDGSAASSPSDVEISTGTGRDVVPVPVRLVNDYGAAVAGGDVTVSVSGPTASPVGGGIIPIDATGYGVVNVAVSGPEAFTVTVLDSPAGTSTPSTRAYGLGAAMPDYKIDPGGVLPSAAETPTFVAAAANGLVLGTEQEIWYLPGGLDQQGHRVATFPDNIEGLISAQLDGDGQPDVIAWTATHVYTLRSWEGGGFAWGTSFESEVAIVGLAAGDFNGDRNADIAVGLSDGVDGWVQIMEGSGSWCFSETEPLALSYPILDVAAMDEDLDGNPDITVIAGNTGMLRRYTWQDDAGWVGSSPPEIYGYEAVVGSKILPPADLNGDGVPEIIIVGPTGSGNQSLDFADVADAVPTTYHLAYESFYTALADMNSDGVTDLLVLSEGVLRIVTFSSVQNGFVAQSVPDMGSAGPLAAVDLNGDDVLDVAIVSEGRVRAFLGEITLDGGEPEWGKPTRTWSIWGADLTGTFVPHVFGEDTLAGFIGWGSYAGVPAVLAWHMVEDGTGSFDLTNIANVNHSATTSPQDLAVCNDVVYALAQDGATTTLYAYDLVSSGDGAYSLHEGATADASGDAFVVCGNLAGSNVVATLGPSGACTYYDADLDPSSCSETSGTVADAAAALDGSGAHRIVTCAAAGCSLAVGDTDGDGVDEVLVGGDTVECVQGVCATEGDNGDGVLAGSGVVSAGDVDLDGAPDFMAVDSDSGTMFIYRGLAGGLAPPLVMHTTRDIFGPVYVGDADGDSDGGGLDSLPEFFFVTETADIQNTPGTDEAFE